MQATPDKAAHNHSMLTRDPSGKPTKGDWKFICYKIVTHHIRFKIHLLIFLVPRSTAQALIWSRCSPAAAASPGCQPAPQCPTRITTKFATWTTIRITTKLATKLATKLTTKRATKLATKFATRLATVFASKFATEPAKLPPN